MGMAVCAERARRKEAGEGDIEFYVSFMEIYGERLNDLLDNKCHQGDGLRIREDPKLGVFVPGITENPCAELKDLNATVEYGNSNRAVAATNMNPVSSRSHAVLVFRIVSKTMVDGKEVETTSKINLIDLAGSERASKTGATGDQLKEGAAINGSLTALGQVIREICKNAENEGRKGFKPAYVSFRSSKLTYLLRDCLVGNSRTFMSAHVSPAAFNEDESNSTLRFANSVKEKNSSFKKKQILIQK